VPSGEIGLGDEVAVGDELANGCLALQRDLDDPVPYDALALPLAHRQQTPRVNRRPP
jgi:hypothetical protein